MPPDSGPGAAAAYSRAARVLPFVFTAVALLAAQLPPLFPPRWPALAAPLWYVAAAAAGAAAVLMAVRPATSRRIMWTLGWTQALATVVNGFVVGDGLAMFATWLAIPVLALPAGRIGARGRRALLTAHVIASAAWFGIALMFVAMSTTAVITEDIDTARVTYELMVVFDMSLLPIANFAAALTGIGLGLTTKWGLLRHYWVAVKFFIPPTIVLAAFGFLHDALENAAHRAEVLADSGGAVEEIGRDADVVFWGFLVAMLALLAAMLLSLYKPGGKTRRGRRLTPTGTVQGISVELAETRQLAEDVVGLTLRPAAGGALPSWQPGAHVDLMLPSGTVRQYSLHGDPDATDAYRIAVLREPEGRGGSEEIHRLEPGAALTVRGPRNNFPLVDAPAYVFLAGGIGVAPFLPMIARLDAAGADWRLLYRGRSRATMAFAPELAQRYPDRVRLLPADERPRPDLAALLRRTPDGAAVYCCGPDAMIRAVAEATPADVTLYRERFVSAAASTADDAPFQAELRASGVTVDVAADQSLLSAIRRVDPTVDLSCEDGLCGTCRVGVLAGSPDHRDEVLQPHERERSDVIYPCVSRAHGKRIVLDV